MKNEDITRVFDELLEFCNKRIKEESIPLIGEKEYDKYIQDNRYKKMWGDTKYEKKVL